MDIVHQCLSLASVPYLAPAFSALRFIWSSIEQAKASKCQLDALAQSIAQLLKALDEGYRTGRLLQNKTSTPLGDLCRFAKSTMVWILIHTSIMQAPDLDFRSEGSITRIPKSTLYQGSTNCSGRALLPTHWCFD
jgi:cytochrome b